MTRTVTITVQIDPTEYAGAADTAKGVANVVEAILLREADWPSGPIVITCDGCISQLQIP